MPLEVEQVINAPLPVVWDQLTRVSQWPRWGPSVIEVECADEHIQLGTIGRVRTVFGLWLAFEVDTMEPGRSWHWRVANVSATGHRVEPVTPGSCRLVFEIPTWAVLYRPVCRKAAARIAQICAEFGSREII